MSDALASTRSSSALTPAPVSGTTASAAGCICCKCSSVLATTAGGAAAFADVTTAGRAHLGAADEAQWRISGATLMRLQQLGRTVRPGGHLVVLRAGGRLLRSGAAGCRRLGRIRLADGLFPVRRGVRLP